MKPTEEFVEERFRHFNALCFGGILPEVPVVLTSVKSYIGMCSYRKRRIGRGRYEYYDFKFRINTRIDLSESEWEDIILHEMIHYYIALNGLQDSSAHGPLFRKMMRFINGTYGRHITVTQRTSAVQREQLTGTKARERVVAMVSFRDGRTGLKVLPSDKRAVAAYRRGILRSPRIESVEFYLVKDAWFNRYPCSRALNVIYCDKAELLKHLSGERFE